MAYNIVNIDIHVPEEGKLYFFDANVWIFLIDQVIEPRREEKMYIDFFDALINLSDNPKCKQKPTIAVNSLVVAESFNAYIRMSFDRYKKYLPEDPDNTLSPEEIDNLKFKKDYRETDDHDVSKKRFIDDFAAFSPYLTFLDNNPKLDISYILSSLPANTDFNDYYYYETCLNYGCSLVTNDSDFIYADIEIITARADLLRLA